MKITKLQTLVEVNVIREVRVVYDTTAAGWTMLITYKANPEDKTEVLERQRGGPRVFATLEAALNVLTGLGIHEFQVSAREYRSGS